MNEPHSLFNRGTGELTGFLTTGDQQDRALNTPPGHAWIAGNYDRRRFFIRVVVDDFGVEQPPEAVERAPDRPTDTAYTTWSWDGVAGDWKQEPTLLWLKRQAGAPILRQLDALDAPLARPLTDLLLAVLSGAEAPSAALAKVEAVESQKAPLRARLAQIEATASPDELAALAATWTA